MVDFEDDNEHELDFEHDNEHELDIEDDNEHGVPLNNNEPRVEQQQNIQPEAPIGWYYDPSDKDVIRILELMIRGSEVPYNRVVSRDLYSDIPSEITRDLVPSLEKDSRVYMIYTRTKALNRGEAYSRSIYGEKGSYEGVGKRSFVIGADEAVIGTVLKFRFKIGSLKDLVKGLRETTWEMVEYRIYGRAIKDLGHHVICKLFEGKKSETAKAREEYVRKHAALNIQLEKQGKKVEKSSAISSARRGFGCHS